MTTNETCGSSCSLPTPAQDLAQEDESSSDTSRVVSEDTTDYHSPGTIDQHGKSSVYTSTFILQTARMLGNDVS